MLSNSNIGECMAESSRHAMEECKKGGEIGMDPRVLGSCLCLLLLGTADPLGGNALPPAGVQRTDRHPPTTQVRPPAFDAGCFASPTIRWDGPVPTWVLNCSSTGCTEPATCGSAGNGSVEWCDCDPENMTLPDCCTSGIQANGSGPVAIGVCSKSCSTGGACVVLSMRGSSGCITGP